MNNRKRARIRLLKRECRSKLRKYRNYDAASAMICFQYAAAINRVTWGIDFLDEIFTDFIKLTRGVDYKFKLIWKKTARTRWVAPPERLMNPLDFNPLFDTPKTRMMIVYKPLTVGPTFGR